MPETVLGDYFFAFKTQTTAMHSISTFRIAAVESCCLNRRSRRFILTEK
jgi:hypothetical protein